MEHGILGVVCLIAIWFAYKKDREAREISVEKDELHKAHATQLQEVQHEHKNEMMALEERYITKAETWMQQYHDNARGQTDALSSLSDVLADMERNRPPTAS